MFGIIGGSVIQSIKSLDMVSDVKKVIVRTPFGAPSSPIALANINGQPAALLMRHGVKQSIAPHLINYRANIWALRHLGCRNIVSFSAMFSINEHYREGQFVIPDQLIDYTWSRKASFFDSHLQDVNYTDFLSPYSESIRARIQRAAKQTHIAIHDQATYGITQGPRFETHAEIARYQAQGCDLLGMTGMPEASLAQELQLEYATCGLISAELCHGEHCQIHDRSLEVIHQHQQQIITLLKHFFA